ncbi:Hsp20/alpha crystallin family protein [Aquisphaera giovannonii]|nr:Hsp20/alpha crystallin family protein [Aquisphaera giovannonii]
MSLWADEEDLYIEVDTPGVEEKDVELTVHGDVLTIKAGRAEPEGRKYLFNGRAFGRFERTLRLPEAVDSEKVDATLSGGVLRLTLPRKAEARPRKITLKGS